MMAATKSLARLIAHAILFLSLSPMAFADGSGASRSARSQPRQGTLACTPTNLRPNQPLTVNLPEKHGTDFAIVDPKNRYFFISFRPDASAPNFRPIIPEQVFRAQRTLVIDPKTAKGVPWVTGGSGAPAKIFERSGVYRLLLSEALETEDPVLDGWCEVQFSR
jgi:hypothetical protein